MVLAGVLVAFLLNGWWQGMKDAEKEHDYLRYIYRDLHSTIVIVERAVEIQRATTHGAAQVMAAAYSDAAPPDSILLRHMYRALSFAPSSQVSTTLASLINTGDVQLIADDSLRLLISELMAKLHAYEENTEHMAFEWLIPTYERYAEAIGLADLRFQIFPESLLAHLGSDSLSGFPTFENLRKPEPRKVAHLLSEPHFINVAMQMQIAQYNLYQSHRGMLEELKQLRSAMERHMQRCAISFEPVATEVHAVGPSVQNGTNGP